MAIFEILAEKNLPQDDFSIFEGVLSIHHRNIGLELACHDAALIISAWAGPSIDAINGNWPGFVLLYLAIMGVWLCNMWEHGGTIMGH